MRTEIFYFSGTGNTLALARELAGKLEDTTLTSIPACKEEKVVSTADAVGIFFPVYALGMPRAVAAFAARLEIPGQSYVFGVANYGGVGRNALLQLDRALRRQQRKLHAGFGIAMPSNYTPFGGAESDAVQKRKFQRATDKIAVIADAVGERRPARIEHALLLPFAVTHALYRWLLQRILRDVKKFRATEKCIGCGLCARVCPVGNIALSDKRPVWGSNCEQCLACLQWCPSEAVEITGHTEGKKRYHHPDVAVDDMVVDMRSASRQERFSFTEH